MKKYKLIANPAAGRGKAGAVLREVTELLRARGADFDWELTTGPGQAAEIARSSLDKAEVIVAVGGDGTVNEILPALLHTGKPLGVIPAGSGNDFIKALHIPNDIGQATDILFTGNTAVIDVGRINDAFFANGVGVGFDAAVNRTSHGINHSKRGLWLYVCALLQTLGRYDPVHVTVSIDGEVTTGELFLLTIGNGTTVGGGFKLTPHARVDDGLLDVTIVRPLGILTLLWYLPKVIFGTIDRATRHARLTRARKLCVTSDRPVPVHVDGEIYESKDMTYRIEVIPRALTVITKGSEPNPKG